jgi:hypothetical protein
MRELQPIKRIEQRNRAGRQLAGSVSVPGQFGESESPEPGDLHSETIRVNPTVS